MEQAPKWDNAFKVNFDALPIRPREAEVHDLLGILLSKKGVVKRAHLVSPANTVFVQMSSKEEAEEIVEQHRGKHGKTIDGVCYPIEIQLADGATDIKILDLPYYVTDETLAKELEKYGQVLAVRELTHGENSPLAGILSGVRVVRMVRKHPIASYLHIGGELTRIGKVRKNITKDLLHCFSDPRWIQFEC